METSYREPARDIAVLGDFDVVICGGGPAGCAAALSARRAGCSVLLIESQSQLGGMGTSGLCTVWLGGYMPMSGSYRPVVGGIFHECVRELVDAGAATEPSTRRLDTHSVYDQWVYSMGHGVVFDPHQTAYLLERKLLAAGVDILYDTHAMEAACEGTRITHITAHNKSGIFAVRGRAIIDATGDADLAARTGCDIVCGRAGDGLMTPVSLLYLVEGVDEEAARAYMDTTPEGRRFLPIIHRLQAEGNWPFNTDNFIMGGSTYPGVLLINTNRIVGVDGTDGRSVSRALQQGREEIFQLLKYMKSHFPGLEHCRIRQIASRLGVRETRRIVGEYVLSVDDLVAGKRFDDTIGFSSYGWDLPDPKRPTHQPMYMGRQRVEHPLLTPIPYRIMLPRPVTNLICPGRAVSVERDVLGPLRVMAPVMAMGEAAGLAAAQVVRSEIPFMQVDVPALRAALRAGGALVAADDIA